jgi:hypothetical protein
VNISFIVGCLATTKFHPTPNAEIFERAHSTSF